MKQQVCRIEIDLNSENEFLNILKENNINSYEYIDIVRDENKTYSIYDVEFENQSQYNIIKNNSVKCKLIPIYD